MHYTKYQITHELRSFMPNLPGWRKNSTKELAQAYDAFGEELQGGSGMHGLYHD